MTLNLPQMESLESWCDDSRTQRRFSEIRRRFHSLDRDGNDMFSVVKLTCPELVRQAMETIRRARRHDYNLEKLYIQHCL